MDKPYFDDHYRDVCSAKTLQSNSEGFFMTFADFVSEKAGENWINNVFGKLKTDRERIKTIYNYKATKEPVINFLSNVQEIYRKKDAQISQKRRSEAEVLLKKGDYQKSLQFFSQSVLRAPKQGQNTQIDNGLSLALALVGRSQALVELQEFTLALSDLQESMKEDIPQEYKPLCFWKMGICYKAMNEENRANVSFELAKKLLKDEENLRKLEEDKKNTFVNKADVKLGEGPSLSGPPHPDYPQASKKIAVKTSTEMGRHTVAYEKINTGDTLVVEQPYAAVLLPSMSGTHCHHCFERLVAPVGCWDCSNVAFCKVQCRNEALATYHKYECRFLDLLIGSGMSILAHAALRIITQNTLEKTLEIHKNRGKENIYSLCTNAHLRKAGDFLQRTLMAAFLLTCLQKAGYFGKKQNSDKTVIPTEQEYSVGEMLLFNLQMLQFNAHEVYENRYHTEHRFRGSKTVYMGVAIYPIVALFNHECLPGVTRYFVGKKIVIKASRPLDPNELIAENYGPVFTHKRLKDRQIWLSSRYWFTCKCQACLNDWPGLDNGLDAVSKRLKCPTKNCQNIFTLPLSNEVTLCPKCKKEVTLTDRILLLKWCEAQYEIGFEYVKADSEKAIDVLCTALDTFYKISCPPHKGTHLAEAYLRACFAYSGNMSNTLLKTTEQQNKSSNNISS